MYATPPSPLRWFLLVTMCVTLAGCEIPGVWPDPRIAQREAESKAIGGACRHALRGVEDCYTLNPKASKAAIFAGWKDMDQYMRDNKLDGAPSVLIPNDGKGEKTEKKAKPEGESKESAPPPKRKG